MELFSFTCGAFVYLLAEPNHGLDLSIRAIWSNLSWPGVGVVVTLFLMSVYSIAVMLERYLTFKAAARQSREFVPKVAERLRAAQLEEALQLSQTYRRSHLAMVVNSGLQALVSLPAQALDVAPERHLRKAKRALRRATAMKTTELQRGLSALATVGSTAPFVGLFGTVVGIINCFQLMKTSQESGFNAIAGGISEALVTTAFGLVVAIPAVWAFNYFTNRLHGFAVEMNNSADELMDYFLQQREQASVAQAK
jgi:biopolymer transport protein ExbB/TolQ